MVNLPLSRVLVGRNTRISRLPWDSRGLPMLAVSAAIGLFWNSIIPIVIRESNSIVSIFHGHFCLVKDSRLSFSKRLGFAVPPTPHPPFARHIFSGPPGRGSWDRLNFLEPFPRFQFPEHSGSVLCSSVS